MSEKEAYTVFVQELSEREVEIEATSEDEALELVKQMYDDEDIVLDYEDFVSKSFTVGKPYWEQKGENIW